MSQHPFMSRTSCCFTPGILFLYFYIRSIFLVYSSLLISISKSSNHQPTNQAATLTTTPNRNGTQTPPPHHPQPRSPSRRCPFTINLPRQLPSLRLQIPHHQNLKFSLSYKLYFSIPQDNQPSRLPPKLIYQFPPHYPLENRN